jgi:hypothetical protein
MNFWSQSLLHQPQYVLANYSISIQRKVLITTKPHHILSVLAFNLLAKFIVQSTCMIGWIFDAQKYSNGYMNRLEVGIDAKLLNPNHLLHITSAKASSI